MQRQINLSGEYKSSISDELLKEATAKLEEEAFVGAISGEIVTEAIHDFCKVNLGLSESNSELFKKASGERHGGGPTREAAGCGGAAGRTAAAAASVAAAPLPLRALLARPRFSK